MCDKKYFPEDIFIQYLLLSTVEINETLLQLFYLFF